MPDQYKNEITRHIVALLRHVTAQDCHGFEADILKNDTDIIGVRFQITHVNGTLVGDGPLGRVEGDEWKDA